MWIRRIKTNWSKCDSYDWLVYPLSAGEDVWLPLLNSWRSWNLYYPFFRFLSFLFWIKNIFVFLRDLLFFSKPSCFSTLGALQEENGWQGWWTCFAKANNGKKNREFPKRWNLAPQGNHNLVVIDFFLFELYHELIMMTVHEKIILSHFVWLPAHHCPGEGVLGQKGVRGCSAGQGTVFRLHQSHVG